MKQTIISRLVVGALAALAVTSSFAGQIQSSSVSIAREVITSDSQKVTAPSISYRFFGDIDARNQAQTFQVQFTLTSGEWASIGKAVAAGVAPQISITDQQGAAAIAQSATTYTVDALAISTDKKTLFATITVVKGAADVAANQPTAGVIKQPLIAISTAAAPIDNPTVTKLYTNVVKPITECDVAVYTLPINFKHYVALQDPSAQASDTNATKDEHNRPSSQNDTMLITFPTNIKVVVEKSIGTAKLNPSKANAEFAGTVVADTIPGKVNAYRTTTLVNLGQVRLVQNAQGYDANLADKYLLSGNAAQAGVNLKAAAAHGKGTAALAAGDIESDKVQITVSASQGFVNKGKLFLATDAACATPLGSSGSTITFDATTATQVAKLTIDKDQADYTAAFGATGTNPVHVCYDVSAIGGATIPGSNFAVDAALLSKAPGDTTNFFQEQNNYCKGPLFPLSGSIKIDVRNYASAARGDKWISVIRLINNSEVKTVDVYGQYIQASGLYGNWGKLATLAPRAVLNMDATKVDSLLTNAPAHPTAANNATSAVSTTGDAPRLRITAVNGDTLRVQNYLYNPASQNFIEASSSQGVDFSANDTRAQTDGNLNDQDAQVGLNGGN